MMTTSLSALPSSLAALLTNYASSGTKTTADSTATTAQAASLPTPAGGALGADPAYTLKLGAQGAASAMIGYTKLATLGRQFEGTMGTLEEPAGSTGPAAGSVTVDVQQLAQAQTLVSGAFGDSDTVSLGTGSLTLQTGSVGSDGSFTAAGSPTSIPIKTGTLDDIVSSINAAKAGVTASVVEEGGGYALKLTGSSTGANQAFSVAGLSELAFDPATPNTSMLTESQSAQDATYAIDGNTFTFGSNSKVPVAFGVTTDFTATGSTTVATPSQATSIQSLVGAFNTIQQSIAKAADKNGDLANDVNLAAGMFKNLGDAATGTVTTTGQFSSLSQIGVNVQPDGTLSIDQTALAAAISTSPTDVQSLISAVSTAMDAAMSPYLGAKGSIASQSHLLSAQMMQGSSLLDYLDSTTSGSSSSQSGLLNSLTGSSSGTTSATGVSSSPKTLLDYLNGASSSSSSGSSSKKSLLDYLNADSSASSTSGFTAA